MTARTWETFYPDVLPDVLGCPEPTVDRHLLRAAQEFCRRTLVYRADLAAITTVADTASYAITFPSGTQLVKLLGATLAGDQIDVDNADATSLEDRRAGNRGDKRVLLRDPLTVTIMPTQAADLELILEAALQPAEDATGLEHIVADPYRLAVCTGALATLLDINKAEWRNTTLAEKKARAFELAIGKAQHAAWKAYGRTKHRVPGQYY